jgi:cobalt-zinc-cadmium efflux system protein
MDQSNPSGSDSHDHAHHHHHAVAGDRKVMWSVVVNVLLTVAQIVGGIFAGSLALIADAIHNLSDAVALGLAFAARRIARRPADYGMTFGYGRAEIVAALVNYTALVLIAVYLAYEGIWRLIEPEPVDGWIVVIIAGIALVIDVATVMLTFRLSKESANIRAAFLHNLADALGSLGVIIAGTLIILFDWNIADALITLAIAGYILWHVAAEIGGVIRILMLGTPPDLSPDAVLAALRTLHGVDDVHHLHIWQFDERQNALEAHLVMSGRGSVSPGEIKRSAKQLLAGSFAIEHATLEIEAEGEDCPDTVVIRQGDCGLS